MSELAEIHAQKLSENADFVRRVAYALVQNPSDAEDLAQETCLAALQGGPGQPEALRAWLRSTARNIACKLHRGRQRRASRERELPAPVPEEATETIVERLQMQRKVVDAVLELSEPCRTALLLRYYEDLGPRQIALRQQVPLDTVRARLRRGLERLRIRLDAEHHGDRSAWCAALLPLSKLGGSTLAASGSAGLAAGFLGLFTKISAWAAALLLLGSLLAAYLFVDANSNPLGGSALDAGRETAQADRPLDVDGPGAKNETGTDDLEVGPERLPVLDPLPTRGVEPGRQPGRVLFRPFDATSGKAAPNVSVRYLSEDRFADGGLIEGTANALLTAGIYRAALSAPGYEPKELGPFTIQSERTVDLGYVAMNRGFGAIEGLVRAASHAPGTEITVLLLGPGRHPCRTAEVELEQARPAGLEAPEATDANTLWSRETPCPQCGFAAEASRLQLQSGDHFEFTGLASGPYLLRAFIDGPHPVGTNQELVLGPGSRRFEELVLSRTVQLTFELRDPDGNPVTGLFETEAGTRLSSVRFLCLEGTRTRAEARVGATHSMLLAGTRATLLATQINAGIQRLSWRTLTHWNLVDTMAESEDQTDLLEGVSGEQPLDRFRNEDDTLFASPTPPSLEPPSLTARMEEPGRFTVDAVPAETLDIVVRCGPLISDRISLDLRAYNGRVIWLKLHPTDEPPEEEESSEVTDLLLLTGGTRTTDYEISVKAGPGLTGQVITVGEGAQLIITEDQ